MIIAPVSLLNLEVCGRREYLFEGSPITIIIIINSSILDRGVSHRGPGEINLELLYAAVAPPPLSRTEPRPTLITISMARMDPHPVIFHPSFRLFGHPQRMIVSIKLIVICC